MARIIFNHMRIFILQSITCPHLHVHSLISLLSLFFDFPHSTDYLSIELESANAFFKFDSGGILILQEYYLAVQIPLIKNQFGAVKTPN